MAWDPQLPWVTRPLGDLPTTLRERWRVVRFGLKDLPRTLRDDSVSEMAAGMSFFLLFSLFPGLVFLVTLLPYLPVEAPLERLLALGRPLLPPEVYTLIEGHLTELVTRPRTSLLTLSAGIALWSASRALVSLSRALNRIYRVEEIRSELRRRLRSMALTLVALLAIVPAVLALSIGDHVVDWVVDQGWLPVEQGVLIAVVRWPILLIFASALVQQLYYLLRDQRRNWRLLSAGSVAAVVLWVIGTVVFSAVVAGFLPFNLTFGSLGSVAVVMAWLYLGSYTLLLGAVLDALIDRGLPPLPEPGDTLRIEAPAAEEPGDC